MSVIAGTVCGKKFVEKGDKINRGYYTSGHFI